MDNDLKEMFSRLLDKDPVKRASLEFIFNLILFFI